MQITINQKDIELGRHMFVPTWGDPRLGQHPLVAALLRAHDAADTSNDPTRVPWGQRRVQVNVAGPWESVVSVYEAERPYLRIKRAYSHPATLTEWLADWNAGRPVEPATFELQEETD